MKRVDVRRAGRTLLNALYPARANCMGCASPIGADEGWLCDECRALLRPVRSLSTPRCMRCGCPSRPGKPCALCGDWNAQAPDFARYAYFYARPVERVVRQMKYAGVACLGDWIAQQIYAMIQNEHFPEFALIVPVPMHDKRLRERGRNHASVIAHALGRLCGLPCEEALRRTRNTAQQARLDGAQRRKNLTGAFQSRSRLDGKSVLLVDDVATTGATLLECAAALREAGATRVLAATLAGPDVLERRNYEEKA